MKREVKNATLTLFVYNQREELLFSNHLLIDSKYGNGSHQITTQIPQKILLPGSYLINTKLHIPNVSFIDKEDNSIAFNIEDTGSDHSQYTQNHGIISINLNMK